MELIVGYSYSLVLFQKWLLRICLHVLNLHGCFIELFVGVFEIVGFFFCTVILLLFDLGIESFCTSFLFLIF